MRLALAQLNTVVGDIEGNLAMVAAAIADAQRQGADLTLVPELALAGYPPEDLLLRPGFARATRASLDRVAGGVVDGAALVGFVEWDHDCFNSVAVLSQGRVQAIYRKRFLPNYGVFDEARYFRAGDAPLVVELLGVRIGIAICEDIWYPTPVASDLAAASVDLICCVSASPFHCGKGDVREAMLATRAYDCSAALAFCNLVGGQDELVFDGRSAVFDASGLLVVRAAQFTPQLLVTDLDRALATRRRLREPLVRQLGGRVAPAVVPIPATAVPTSAAATANGVTEVLGPEAEIWQALVIGLGDYVRKNRFPGVLIGLSGGIDSALTAVLAVDALGSQAVTGVRLPSAYTSDLSSDDAAALAELLGIRLLTVPIGDVVACFEGALAEAFAGADRDVTEENLQARARGTLLMGLSNKLGALVLATGNKSEMSVGYSTLYGDMVGGFAPIRDISKTWVYRLARWRNARDGGPAIPHSSIERPPTAELRHDQLDTDSLPPYEALDPILEGFVENDLDADELVARGGDPVLVREVIRMVERSEYKRRQGPVGIKITPRAFGKDRRMPITNRYA